MRDNSSSRRDYYGISRQSETAAGGPMIKWPTSASRATLRSTRLRSRMAAVRRRRNVLPTLESSAVVAIGRFGRRLGTSDDISPYQAGAAASKSVGRPTKASAARTAREGRQRHLRRLSLMRHLRGFAPVGGVGEHTRGGRAGPLRRRTGRCRLELTFGRS